MLCSDLLHSVRITALRCTAWHCAALQDMALGSAGVLPRPIAGLRCSGCSSTQPTHPPTPPAEALELPLPQVPVAHAAAVPLAAPKLPARVLLHRPGQRQGLLRQRPHIGLGCQAGVGGLQGTR